MIEVIYNINIISSCYYTWTKTDIFLVSILLVSKKWMGEREKEKDIEGENILKDNRNDRAISCSFFAVVFWEQFKFVFFLSLFFLLVFHCVSMVSNFVPNDNIVHLSPNNRSKKNFIATLFHLLVPVCWRRWWWCWLGSWCCCS